MPKGKNDRRYDIEGASAQVFNDNGRVVIAFNRNSMYQTYEEVMKERNELLKKNKALETVGGACTETIATHECGHVMSRHITSALIYEDETAKEYFDWYESLSKEDKRNGLSEYGATNRGEFEAECFLELQMQNPRPIAKKFGEFLDKIMSKGY